MRELLRNDRCLQVVHDALTMSVFNGAVDSRDLMIIWENDRAIVQETGTLTSITVLTGRLSMRVDEQVKRIGGDMTRELEHVSLGGAVVLEASGVKASFFRTILSTIHLIGRGQRPNQMFRSLNDSIDWAIGLEGQRPQVSDARDEIHRDFARVYGDYVSSVATSANAS